jgi:hypothetical protein
MARVSLLCTRHRTILLQWPCGCRASLNLERACRAGKSNLASYLPVTAACGTCASTDPGPGPRPQTQRGAVQVQRRRRPSQSPAQRPLHPAAKDAEGGPEGLGAVGPWAAMGHARPKPVSPTCSVVPLGHATRTRDRDCCLCVKFEGLSDARRRPARLIT